MTAVIQVEALLNSRPLTYMSSDDLVEALTPSHLRRILTLPDVPPAKEEDEYIPTSNTDVLTHKMRHLINSFWKRWQREYVNFRTKK